MINLIVFQQDCNDEATRNVILSYKDITLISQPDQSDIAVPPKEKKFKGYYKIARHYGWALNTTFKQGFEYVIIVEGMFEGLSEFGGQSITNFKLQTI